MERESKPWTPVRHWVLALAAAEGVGMTAAAAAARVTDSVVGAADGSGEVLFTIGLAVAGGVVEGVAVSVAMAGLLRSSFPRLPVGRWVAVTTLVAALGWAAGTVPAALSGDGSSQASPPLALILVGAAAIGVMMGAVLGGAQALVLHGVARHPFRWVSFSAMAWCPAMAVIFTGATLPDSDWADVSVIALGLGTGLIAGAVLGAVLGLCAPSLGGPSVPGRILLGLLSSPLYRIVPVRFAGLQVHGRRSGTWHRLVVMVAAGAEHDLIIGVGHPEQKQWWRNLIMPGRVRFTERGCWVDADASLLRPNDQGYEDAWAAYISSYPTAVGMACPVVRVRRTDAPSPTTLRDGDRRPAEG
ncbi:hypothetical protein [Kineosporia sp. NBRC 101731]|uniref:hypothetical protein n=1 Tax=Kineosporia sp. NBRC 101731 TaxID=3032199 RepID=UPI0025531094|nr:hypothetical protein [Kineosporia sp. NBRC 101731]